MSGSTIAPLTDKLKPYRKGRIADEPLFLSKRGKRLEPDNFVKRHLKPILKKLGLEGAAHGFTGCGKSANGDRDWG